jgi:hypothetical protein
MKKYFSKRNESINKRLMESWGYKEKNVSLDEEGAADIVAADKEAAAFMKAGDAKLGPYVELLKKIQKDPEFRAIASAGKTDGNVEDEVISSETGTVSAADLQPTQAEIGLDQSLKDQMIDAYDNTARALGMAKGNIMLNAKGGPTPLLVYNKKWILDGHHRWSQIMMTNPAAKVAIFSISGKNLKSSEDALKIMNLAIALTAKSPLVTNDFEGTNLYDASVEQIYEYVRANMTAKVAKLFLKAGKMPGQQMNEISLPFSNARKMKGALKDEEFLEQYLEPLAKYYAQNFIAFKEIPAGSNSRIAGMPQAGDANVKQADVNDYLSKGGVNYLDPKPTDVKRDGDEEK